MTGADLVEAAQLFFARRAIAGQDPRPPLRLSRAQRAELALLFLDALQLSPWVIGQRIRQLADAVEQLQTDPAQLGVLQEENRQAARRAHETALREAWDRLDAADLWARVADQAAAGHEVAQVDAA